MAFSIPFNVNPRITHGSFSKRAFKDLSQGLHPKPETLITINPGCQGHSYFQESQGLMQHLKRKSSLITNVFPRDKPTPYWFLAGNKRIQSLANSYI